MTHYHAIIIGTGQSGPSLAGRLTAAGQKVAIIERGAFGGTCVNTGCIPTKTLIASAYAAHLAFRASEFGVDIEGLPRVDMKKVKARKDKISGASRDGIESWLKGMEGCTVYQGHARFTDPHTIVVGSETLTGDRVFINTGGRAIVPDIEGINSVPYFTNSTMMDVDFLPEHLIIIGGSYIGLEFAQMYRRFGSKITIVEPGPRLIGREDPDISDAIAEILAAEDIDIRLNARGLSLDPENDGIRLSMSDSAGVFDIRGSHLLLATGRRPNTDDLGLEAAGIAADARGYITVDDELRTSVPHIWAIGDCNGRGAFTHTSYNDFEIVAANLLDGGSRRVSDRITAYALYIDPPLGRAGMTEAQARAAGKNVLISRRPMTRVGRANEKGESLGFMKIVVDADTKQILGAALLGLSGDEVVHTILDQMYARQPYETVQHAMHIHPTVSELLPTMLGELKPA